MVLRGLVPGVGLPHTPTPSSKPGSPQADHMHASLGDSASTLALPVDHLEALVLKSQEPARHPGVGLFGHCHPLKGGMVGNQADVSPEEVIVELF